MAISERSVPNPIEKALKRASSAGHLDHAVPAQTPIEDELQKVKSLQETIDDLKKLEPREYNPDELRTRANDLSDGLIALLDAKEGKIQDLYKKIKPGYAISHVALPENNHIWRLFSPQNGVLEVRTGPFYDQSVNQTYNPEIKIIQHNGPAKPITGSEAFVRGLEIVQDIFN